MYNIIPNHHCVIVRDQNLNKLFASSNPTEKNDVGYWNAVPVAPTVARHCTYMSSVID